MIARKPFRRTGTHQDNQKEHGIQTGKTDTDHTLFHLLRRSGFVMRHMADERGGQKRILGILKRRGAMTQRELTEILDVRSGSASEILSKIESAGLIVRTPNEEDQRTMDIVLTQAGETAAREAENESEARIHDMFSSLTEEEKAQLSLLLGKLDEDWQKRFPHSPRRPHGPHGPHRRGEHPFRPEPEEK